MRRPLLDGEFIPRHDWSHRTGETGPRPVDGCIDGDAGHTLIAREAVRVLGPEDAASDPYGITGRVDTLLAFIERGFTLGDRFIVLGRQRYHVEYGYLLSAMKSCASPGHRPR
ncbi:MAG: hypothetical protein AAGA56_12130 [Myxococcota bacterium]